jgi:hypothetical protein
LVVPVNVSLFLLALPLKELLIDASCVETLVA